MGTIDGRQWWQEPCPLSTLGLLLISLSEEIPVGSAWEHWEEGPGCTLDPLLWDGS